MVVGVWGVFIFGVWDGVWVLLCGGVWDLYLGGC